MMTSISPAASIKNSFILKDISNELNILSVTQSIEESMTTPESASTMLNIIKYCLEEDEHGADKIFNLKLQYNMPLTNAAALYSYTGNVNAVLNTQLRENNGAIPDDYNHLILYDFCLNTALNIIKEVKIQKLFKGVKDPQRFNNIKEGDIYNSLDYMSTTKNNDVVHYYLSDDSLPYKKIIVFSSSGAYIGKNSSINEINEEEVLINKNSAFVCLFNCIRNINGKKEETIVLDCLNNKSELKISDYLNVICTSTTRDKI